MRQWISALPVLIALATPVLAVQPDEILQDPVLEARARGLSAHLRCMVCQNQSIDDSNADLARDLRVLVRERLVAGDTDDQVMDYVVSRYGEFVLLRPAFNWRNAALWATPVILLVLGGAFAFARRRTATPASSDDALTPEERNRLQAILNQNGD